MSTKNCGIYNLWKGCTVMANLFTNEQQEILRANPYTLSVNDRHIKFTIPFKRFLMNEYSKPGVTLKQAFRSGSATFCTESG